MKHFLFIILYYFIAVEIFAQQGVTKNGQSKSNSLVFVNANGKIGSNSAVDKNGQILVTDPDGNTYLTVTIGAQIWMKENLKTTKYNDGTAIPNAIVTWGGLTTPAYCWVNNDAATYKDTYGALYNWYAINTGKLCPIGLHVPSDIEWTNLQNYLITNGYNYDGSLIGNKTCKALAAASGWTYSPSVGSAGNTDYPAKRNASNFSGLPAGFRDCNTGGFGDVVNSASWWSSTEFSPTNAWYRSVYYLESALWIPNLSKSYGFSVRCIKD